MKKKIVLLDTSFFRAKRVELDNTYPREEWLRCIAGETSVELKSRESKKNDESIRTKTFNEYEKLELRTLAPPIFMVSAEYKQKFWEKFPFLNDDDEQNIKDYINNKAPPDKKAHLETGLIENVRQKEEASEDFFKKIPSHNKGVFSFSMQDIHQKAVDIVNNKILFGVPDPFSDEIISFTDIIIEFCKDVKGSHHIVEAKDLSLFQNKYPSIYMMFIVDIFLGYLKKPCNSVKNFSICFDGKQIKVTKNTLCDVKIPIGALPYVDKFVSLDKGQYHILQSLFPEYTNKIEGIK